MKPLKLLDSLVYMDTGYVADLYEVHTGQSPNTQITMNQGKKAGAAIPVFSAEVSAQETRSFSVSTFKMLQTILPEIEKKPTLEVSTFATPMQSQFGWVRGDLSVFKVTSKVGNVETASEGLYQIQLPGLAKGLALITAQEYFTSGIGNFVRLQDTLLQQMGMEVRAYVRAVPAKSHHGQWVVVPLVMLEV